MRFDRRRFLQGATALAPLFSSGFGRFLAHGQEEHRPGSTLFVGTQTTDGSHGIYAYGWDAEHGSLKLLGLAAATPMPTFLVLAPDKRLLLSANETDTYQGKKTGFVSSFRVNEAQDMAKLAPVNSQAADGAGTTNITLDRTGRTLLAANYGGGSASSFQVSKDGKIGPIVSHFQYTGHGPNHDRQEAPHVHRATVSPGNGFALFNDLGLDVIHIYALDAATAKLTPHTPDAWHAPAGSGPRSLHFHPNGRWAYCITEMGSSVILMDWDEARGTLASRQQTVLTPPGFTGRSQAAEIAIDHTGRFLYASDRYYDGFYSFVIEPTTGELRDMARIPALGKTPRFITLDPTEHWLLSADQDSNDIAIYARDPRTGRLSAHGTTVPQAKPQCLVFV
jgi:6-phosphogluconolactonase